MFHIKYQCSTTAAHEKERGRYKVQPENVVADLPLVLARSPCWRQLPLVDLEPMPFPNTGYCLNLLAMTWHCQTFTDQHPIISLPLSPAYGIPVLAIASTLYPRSHAPATVARIAADGPLGL